MKKNGISLRFIIAVAFATFVAFSVPGGAQTDYQPTTIARLKVQHVRAAMMFWWLTGEKNAQEKYLDSLNNSIAKSLPGLRKLAFDRPTNELIATGAPEGIEELRKVLGCLDRPIRKVELQVQAIEMDEAYLNQGKWFPNDRRAAAIHNGEPTESLPKIIPEQIPQINITGYRGEQFESFINTAREKKLVGDIQTHRIEILNNSNAQLTVEENALTLGWEMALTPTIQNNDTVTLFCSRRLKTSEGQMITTVSNMHPKDTALFLVRKLEQPGRVMIFSITLTSITPQPQ